MANQPPTFIAQAVYQEIRAYYKLLKSDGIYGTENLKEIYSKLWHWKSHHCLFLTSRGSLFMFFAAGKAGCAD